MKKYSTLLLLLTLFSCIPESTKEEVNKNLKIGIQMLADQEFKKAISHIELHKLRNGTYPESLQNLQFLTAMDSTLFNYVEYQKAGDGYELNINYKFPGVFDSKTEIAAELKYPEAFWKGLGCLKSNAK